MKKTFDMLKKWWGYTKPSTKLFLISLISGCLYRTCIVIAPIFTAKVTTALIDQNFKRAIMFLLVGLVLYAIRATIHHIKYMNHSRLLNSSFYRLQKNFADKIFRADPKNFKGDVTKKIMNIFHSDVFNTANFADTLTTKLSYFWQAILTIISIAVINPVVALLVILMIIVNFFIISVLQNKYAQGTKQLREKTDMQYTTFAKLMDSKDYAQDEKIRKKLEKEFLDTNKQYIKAHYKRQPWSSAIANWYYVWCEAFVCIVTIFMVLLVARDSLNLEMYLIVVPYIASAISISNDFLTIFTDLRNTMVYMNRVNIIENFSERDIVRFGKNNYDDVLGEIDFIDLYYTKKANKPEHTNLKDVNFHIKALDTAVILGPRNCGKRTIFDLLIRNIEHRKGNIYFDGLKINEYSKRAYNKNITYFSSKPHFYGGSIMKELKLVCRNENRIKQVCEDLGILDSITELKHGFNSMPDELNAKNKFLLGLARAILSDCGIILIYELPSSVNDYDYEDILNILNKLNGERTFVIFTAVEKATRIADKVIEIESGEVKNITFNKNNVKEDIY